MAVRARTSPIRLGRLFATAAVALLATVGVTGTAGAVTSTTYAALGDSYSSGVGAGSYGSSGDCKRSANAYPQLWANAHAGTTLQFLACSGAKTSDALTQIGSINSGTTLVTISIGGNDAGFTDVITTCTLGSDQTCIDRVNTAKTYVNSTLPPLLDNVYAKIKAKAPDARLLVVGYPVFYTVPGNCSGGLSAAKRTAIDSGSDAIDAVLASRASAAGATFVDPRGNFTGHNLCASGTAYLHGLTFPIDESYHPTVAGQASGYYPAVKAVTG
jgi:lysophospholipase L1-like esterase